MITAAQREKRRTMLGSSDIGAIIGTDERRGPGDVWLSKTGRLVDSEANEHTDRGVALEPYVLDLFERQMDVKLARDIWLEQGDFCANLDGAITNIELLPKGMPNSIVAPVEVKTTNFGRDWNQEAKQPPIGVLVQVTWQIMLAGPHCEMGWAAALFPEFKRFRFEPCLVRRDNELIEELRIAALEFWDYVVRDKMPPNATPHLPTLKRVRREPETVISLGEEAAEEWAKFERAKERLSKWEATKDQRYARLVTMLGQAEGGRLPDGRTLTYLEQNGQRHCDLDALQAESPALYKMLVKQGRHRVLRMKKAKIGGKKR